MTLNREKNAYFFPSKVYRCACLGQTVDYCFENDLNSFNEIHDEINSFVLSNDGMDKVFTTKCGENKKDCIFVCQKHLAIVILAKRLIRVQKNQNLTIPLYFIIVLMVIHLLPRLSVVVASDII